jgi:PKHD-type hydroxylase
MISNYLKSKNIIEFIKPTIDIDELSKDSSDGFFYLNTYPYPNIYYCYENLFTDGELEWIKVIGNRLPAEQGTVGNYENCETDTKFRDSIVSWFYVNNQTKWLYERLANCVLNVNQTHYKYDLEKLETLQFTRYFGNSRGRYGIHMDTINHHNPPNRKLTFVLQLSDPSEYEGGELRLHLGSDPTTIKKQKGLITFFPSYSLHECTPVLKGERYVLVGWVYGPPFK